MSLVWKAKPTPRGEFGVASLFHALGHSKRLQILRMLQARGPLRCGEMVLELELAQSTVSQHLGVLAQAGFVERDPGGGERRYHLRASAVVEARDYLTAL